MPASARALALHCRHSHMSGRRAIPASTRLLALRKTGRVGGVSVSMSWTVWNAKMRKRDEVLFVDIRRPAAAYYQRGQPVRPERSGEATDRGDTAAYDARQKIACRPGTWSRRQKGFGGGMLLPGSMARRGRTRSFLAKLARRRVLSLRINLPSLVLGVARHHTAEAAEREEREMQRGPKVVYWAPWRRLVEAQPPSMVRSVFESAKVAAGRSVISTVEGNEADEEYGLSPAWNSLNGAFQQPQLTLEQSDVLIFGEAWY